MLSIKHPLLVDTECYANYWLCKFKSKRTGTLKEFEKWPDCGIDLDLPALRYVLANYLLIGFNLKHYDIPMIVYALTGASCEDLKRASDAIIVGNMKCWEFYERFGLREPDFIDFIDLIEVAPGDGSLKLYGGRLHSRKLQDLPIDPGKELTADERDITRLYCGNDLDTTHDLANHLEPQIELRESMSKMYGLDLRSRSDAQIAEAVIRSELTKIIGRLNKPIIPPGTRFRYTPPKFLRFESDQMRLRLAEIAASEFVIDENGSPIEPPALAGMVIAIGAGRYRMGIGGLHSSEQCVSHYARDGMLLMDADVTSYYPAIILNCELFPKHLTEAFLTVYRSIFERRVKAKREKQSTIEKVLKIVLNGSFGKFGSRYSLLYSPHLMIQVTVTGQLALLMLIERLYLHGIECVSANTDGIVLHFHEADLDEVRQHIKWWEKATGFTMEETFYKALHSRDVNNYLAVKQGGGVKGKGDYADISIAKNPSNAIVNTAVKAFLEHGTPLGQTITDCEDIRQFLTVQRVTGGAIKVTKTNYDESLTPGQKRDFLLANGWHVVEPGPIAKLRLAPMAGEPGRTVEAAYREHCGEDEFEYLGKVVRFYIGRGVEGALHYRKRNASGARNKVPASDGAVPCMDLPDALPRDIDHDFYIREAEKQLKLLGVTE